MPQDTAVTSPKEACCAPSSGVMDAELAARVSAVAKVLADPVRLRIFQHIATSDCSSVCACHMPDVFGISQPTLSHHLKKLVDAGLVDRQMRGRWAHFTPRPQGLALLRSFLHDLPE